MFDDHWGICCQSQDSAGKRPSRHHNISKDQENSRKIPENYILPKDSGSQKEESRESRG
jgi:hypothetical protein